MQSHSSYNYHILSLDMASNVYSDTTATVWKENFDRIYTQISRQKLCGTMSQVSWPSYSYSFSISGFNPLKSEVSIIKKLIYCSNQLTGIYVVTTITFNELMLFS